MPNFFGSLGYKALAFFVLGRQNKASLAHDMATQLTPTDRMAWKGKGAPLFIQEKYDGAIAAFGTAIQISPADAAKAWKDK